MKSDHFSASSFCTLVDCNMNELNTGDDQYDSCEFISEWPAMNDSSIKHDNWLNKTCSAKEWHNKPYPIMSPEGMKFKRHLLSQEEDRKRLCRQHSDCVDFKNTREESLARISIAKWWRHHGHCVIDREDLPKTNNANTLLSAVSRSNAGKEFIKDEIERLSSLLKKNDMRADVYAALGSFLECSRQFVTAKHNLERAILLRPDNKEYRWLLFKVRKQIRVQKDQIEGLKKLENLELKADMTPCKSVQRISVNDLSFKDFFYKYELTSTPVVITDLVPKMTTEPWTFDHIKQKAGDCMVTVKTPVPRSVEWARLEDSRTTTVIDFLRDLDNSEAKNNYLFDWSLPIHCPALAQELTIPKYFANDFLQRTAPGTLYKDSWPSLFIAPAGLISELHVDAFGSNFWMALFEGKKRWVFFPRRDVPYLYPKYESSMDPVFDVDLSAPNFNTHPLLRLTEPVECILQPGELLFVPAGCPHRVENLEKSLAISANFVDLSNIELVKEELHVNSIVDERACDLYMQITHQDFVKDMNCQIKDLKWSEFKNWEYSQNGKYDIKYVS